MANGQTLSCPGLACSSVPAAPSNLSAVVTDGYVVHLSWTDNSDNEDGFEIFRCSSFSTSFCEFRVAVPDLTAFEDQPCGGCVGLASEAVFDKLKEGQ